MFTNLAASLSLVAALASFTLAPVVAFPSAHAPHVHRSVPSQFDERGYKQDSEFLEPYTIYNARYHEFDCEDKHGDKKFFDACCHPLKKNQSVSSLPDLCYASCDPEPPKTTSSHKIVTSAKPTSTHKPASTTPHTSSHKPTTSAAAVKKPASSNGDGGDWKTKGFATYFLQEGNAGACGNKHSDWDLIVAIDQDVYGHNFGVVSQVCGKSVEIVNMNNGKSVIAKVADVCPTCKNSDSIDLSRGTFAAIDDNYEKDGMVPIKWRWVS